MPSGSSSWPLRQSSGPFVNCLFMGVALSLSNPFDFVRFRMQTMNELVKLGSLSQPYSNIGDCYKRVVLEQGKRAFWKGNVSSLLKFYPTQALNWFSKQMLHSSYLGMIKQGCNNTLCDFVVNYIGGALAGISTRMLLYPLEYTRNMMNNQIKRKNGIVSCLKEALCKDGVRGIYRGALTSLVGVGIFRSTYFGIYDTFKNKTDSCFTRWLVSYWATITAISLTYPLDTVRRRIMLTSVANYKYNGILDCAKVIWSAQGYRGFYSGGSIIFLQGLSGATIYYLFDRIVKDFKERRLI